MTDLLALKDAAKTDEQREIIAALIEFINEFAEHPSTDSLRNVVNLWSRAISWKGT